MSRPHTHTHKLLLCGFLLKNSQSERVNDRWAEREVGHLFWKNLRRGAAARAPSHAPQRCCPPSPSIFACHPSASFLPTSHPSRRTCVASVATRGLSERPVHKCQSRFCFRVLCPALFSRHRSSLCLHCKATWRKFLSIHLSDRRRLSARYTYTSISAVCRIAINISLAVRAALHP